MEVHKDCFLNGSRALFGTNVDFFKTRISPRFSPREEHKENSYITHTTQWQAKTSFASYLTPIPSFIESYKLCENEFILTSNHVTFSVCSVHLLVSEFAQAFNTTIPNQNTKNQPLSFAFSKIRRAQSSHVGWMAIFVKHLQSLCSVLLVNLLFGGVLVAIAIVVCSLLLCRFRANVRDLINTNSL